ncbi:GNAT family N-acetyltransferase [uncultured Tateyamaria sp.]|uniref:GNAT family N-acetyltransferase n=1 Tax=uncultured Tateyamaria sp. TaxID=455651 RepID=UPI002615F809|nr:GNAT family N-acetyltransferase [uncultured Tateyamaria sp.]
MTVQDTCALRRARPDDAQRIEAFLATHPATSMFLRSNLAAHGLVASDAAHATEMFMIEKDRQVCGVLGLTNGGYLLAQLPNPPRNLSEAIAAWRGRTVRGMTGVSKQVAHVLREFGLADTRMWDDTPEPLYDMDLERLKGPFASLRPPNAADRSMLEAWFYAYLQDTDFGDSEDAMRCDARARAQRAIERQTCRLLLSENAPVAMTDFNAEVADVVQVGGVFVPRPLRNRGYGRRVVAAHLSEARARGITRAILCAASAPAARAYESIGFRRIGTYRVALFGAPVEIRGAH